MKFNLTAVALGAFAVNNLVLAAPRAAVDAAASAASSTLPLPSQGATTRPKDAHHSATTSTAHRWDESFTKTVYMTVPTTESIDFCGGGNCTLFPPSIKPEDVNPPQSSAGTTLNATTPIAGPSKVTQHGLIGTPVGVKTKQHHNNNDNEGLNGWLNRHIFSQRAAPAATKTETEDPAPTDKTGENDEEK